MLPLPRGGRGPAPAAISGGVRRISMIRKTLAGAIALAALFVPTAAADKPVTVPSPFPDSAGRYCEGFDVLVHATTNNGTTHIFSSGAIMFTGSLKVEVTNLDSDKTIALNISGPG